MSQSTQNRSFQICSSQTISWISTEKLNLIQQQQTHICNKIYYNTNKHNRKLKPVLVASSDLQPENKIDPFLRK